MRRLGAILLWSVIAAAFIGPGTVATAASAGAGHGFALLWTLVFSTAACLVLQEAAGRLTVVSGRSLGEALRAQYPRGLQGGLVLLLVLGAVVVGCAAYEAGNILGGVAGATLGVGGSAVQLTLIFGGVAAVLLWLGSPRTVARLLSVLVAVMGIAFLATAVRLAPAPLALLRGAAVPTLPPRSGLLALGLVGTTVVPYNLFLGSGLARDQRLGEMRLGLAVSVVLGGLISMGILVVGTRLQGEFSFEALAASLAEGLGPWAAGLLALGLFAAGLSSAVTAPLAAAVTVRDLFGARRPELWTDRSPRFRAVWLGVLAVGVLSGVSGIRAVPAIIAAQALNGILLPVAALFLLLAVNDRKLMGVESLNGGLANLVGALILAVTLLLGVGGLLRAAATAFGRPQPGAQTIATAAVLAGALAVWPILRAARRRRSGK